MKNSEKIDVAPTALIASSNKIKRDASDRAIVGFSYIFLGLYALLCLLPLVLVFSVSFSEEPLIARYGYSLFPRGFTFDTYLYIFDHSGHRIARSYGVTIFVTFVGTFLAMLMTTMTAFALSIRSLKYRNKLAFLCNFTIIFSAGLIPWYNAMVNFYSLNNTIWGLILPASFSVWNMFLMRTFFNQISSSLYESARIDGANYFQVYYKIALPLSKTALLTVGLMYALMYWNDWWHALLLVSGNRDLYPLQFYLYSLLSNIAALTTGQVAGLGSRIRLPAETARMAVTIITIGPIILLYPFIQRFFIANIMSGAVKE